MGLKLSKLGFLFALFVLSTGLGCPLLHRAAVRYRFGVILVLLSRMGQISPPIGINLFVIQSIWDGKLSEVVYGTIPFHLIMFVVLAMVIYWPELALWLPQHMSGK